MKQKKKMAKNNGATFDGGKGQRWPVGNIFAFVKFLVYFQD